MSNRATLITDLMKERLTTDEQWQWQSWWAGQPEDLNQNSVYLRERAEGYAVLLDLQQQGASPADSAVQEQILRQLALMSRKLAIFHEQALRASVPARAVEEILGQVRTLIEARVEPTAAAVKPVVQQFESVCAQQGLGDPTVYVRFTPFLARVNHLPLAPDVAQAFDFLRQAIQAHGNPAKLSNAPTAAPATAPIIDFTPAELAAVRRAYARQMGMLAGVIEPRLEAAFAAVEREKFLGSGPWLVLSMLRGTFMMSPDASPVHLYVDTAVSIIKGKLNNGQPSLYYRLLAEALVPQGAHIVHVGAGTGYYTAILGHLTGATGKVTAIEYEADLAARARANLQDLSQVEVMAGDATRAPFDPADLILVSAGATRPVDHWLDRLKDGGQLVLPLTPDTGMGIIVDIRRRGERYFAKVLSPVMIYRCASARDAPSESALAAALRRGGQHAITRLYRDAAQPPENVWLQGENWCLAYG